MKYIKTTDELKEFCKDLKNEEYIAVDTEFLRESTYYAKLCLIQVASSKEAVLIDPLEPELDMKPFFKVLQNKKILKVFHAARQDLEIFYQLMGKLPTPVFDTQIAAMVMGYGDAIGFASLVSSFLDKKISKTNRFTDWSRRPLTEDQEQYALNDVVYLRPIYDQLKEKLGERDEWLKEENEKMLNEDEYKNDPYESWKRLKIKNKEPKFLNYVREVAAWRERTAQEKNVPRGRIVRDDAIIELASIQPRSKKDLGRGRALPRGFADSDYVESVIEAIEAADKTPSKKYPEYKSTKVRLGDEGEALLDLLKVLIKTKCRYYKVAQKLVASSADLEAFCGGSSRVPFMKGWRFDVFGKDAKDLRDGRIALGFDKKGLLILED